MAFRATNVIPEQGFSRAKALAVNLKNFTSSRSIEYAGGANSERILNALNTLIAFRTQLNEVKTTPGIVQYAQDQEGDLTYDVAAEFVTLIALLETVIANIIITFPTDTGGFLLAVTLDGNGNIVHRVFSAAALAGIRADLDAVANGIS